MSIFFRISAAENTFVLAPHQEVCPEQASKYCALSYGFHSDGMIFLNRSGGRWKWDFFNRDGSAAEMCGNASRAVVLFIGLVEKSDQAEFETARGLVHGKILNRSAFQFGQDMIVEAQLPKMAAAISMTVDGPLVQAGVPHLLRFRPEDHASSLALLKKHNANITYLVKKSAHTYEAKTFERGVENFTRACGTGAIAVAAHDQAEDPGSQTQVHMPGGLLEVSFIEERPCLRGPAKIEFSFREDWKCFEEL